MTARFRRVACALAIATAATPVPALSKTALSSQMLYGISLDIDNDGKLDRAILVLHRPQDAEPLPQHDEQYALSEGESLDLLVYLATADREPNRKPDFSKAGIIDPEETPWVFPLETDDRHALLVSSAYGAGASKSWEQTIAVVARDGKYLVGSYERNWDWNTQLSDGSVETVMGGCEIDFLSGAGIISDGLDETKPIAQKFRPIALSDWSSDKRPAACEF
jgi:hypothetical protein